MHKKEKPRASYRALSPLQWHVGFLQMYVFVPVLVAAMVIVPRASAYSSPAFVAFVITAIAALFAMFWPSSVTLAESGVWIRHYAFRRFIPFASMAKVETIQRLGRPLTRRQTPEDWLLYSAVRLTLKNGAKVHIGTGSERAKLRGQTAASIGDYGLFGGTDPKASELARAIHRGLAAENDAPEPTPTAASLLRGESTLTEWRAKLAAALPAVSEAYRGDGSAEALWRVLEDDDAPRDARAGAAVALRNQLDEAGRTRLRVVAEACDSPKLRVALDAALNENAEEKELLAALEEASDRR